jgi:hypothetical protein
MTIDLSNPQSNPARFNGESEALLAIDQFLVQFPQLPV